MLDPNRPENTWSVQLSASFFHLWLPSPSSCRCFLLISLCMSDISHAHVVTETKISDTAHVNSNRLCELSLAPAFTSITCASLQTLAAQLDICAHIAVSKAAYWSGLAPSLDIFYDIARQTSCAANKRSFGAHTSQVWQPCTARPLFFPAPALQATENVFTALYRNSPLSKFWSLNCVT